jgi:DNA/RNA-binding domain of Phe-tRNA-synthetase-like protein
MPEVSFQVSEKWLQDHPGAGAGVLAISGVDQPKSCPELDAATEAVEQDLKERFSSRDQIKDLPLVQAYNSYYQRFRSNYILVPQMESVALKGRSIPRFLPLVQAMFTAEIKNLILTAGHDLAAVQGGVRLLSADGEEVYTRLGGKEQGLKAGDMYMADDLGVISAVIPGPDDRTKISSATSEAMFAVYAAPGVGSELVESHLNDIESYIRLISPQAQTLLREVHWA